MDAPPDYEGIYGEAAPGAPPAGVAPRRRTSQHSLEPFVLEDPLDYGDGAAAGAEHLLGATGGAAPRPPRARAAIARIKTGIIVPVRHFVVDPVARAWARISRAIDTAIDPWVNPLLARRLFVLVMTGALIFAFYFTRIGTRMPDGVFSDIGALREHLRNYIDPQSMEHLAEYFDSMPHVAGTAAGYATSHYVEEAFKSYGLYEQPSVIASTFMTYRNTTTLVLLDSEGNAREDTLSHLEEGPADPERAADAQHAQPAPHMALGMPGVAEGGLVYANFGTSKDLALLQHRGISMIRKIVAVRYGGGEPAIVAKRIETLGAAGVLFFSEKHPTLAAHPEGPDYAEDSVQRASMGMAELVPGDILSPGIPSSANMHIDDPKDAKNLVQIPVAAMSWRDAGLFLRSLQGHGVQVADWHNNGYPRDVAEWWTGDDTPDSPRVRLEVHPTIEESHSVENVLARIAGRDQAAKAIIIGAPLDTHCGAGVGTSGLTVLLEVAKAFGYLRYEHNWQPLRTLYFFAWDGTAQNFAGATEWLEQVDGQLRDDGVLYIDLDSGISGTELEIRGHPMIDLQSPMQAVSLNNVTLWDSHTANNPNAERVEQRRRFSNGEVFSSHVGMPTVSLGFKGPVYPKDSCFDTFAWLRKWADPDFEVHRALAELVAFTALDYVDLPFIDYNVGRLGVEMHRYIQGLRNYMSSAISAPELAHVDFAHMTKAADAFVQSGTRITELKNDWASLTMNMFSEVPMARSFRFKLNDRIADVNKMMISVRGLPHRNWFKHVLFGPQFDPDPDDELSFTFPSIRDAVHAQSVSEVKAAIKAACLELTAASEVFLV